MIKVETKVLVRNRWHKYKRDKVLLKDRSMGEYFYIDHPSSVAVIPFLPDGRVMVLKCFRYLFSTWIHQFVLGHSDPDADQKEEAVKKLVTWREKRSTSAISLP